MIRREINLPNLDPHWLLISQVEHARLSAVLAEHSLQNFGKAVPNEDLSAIRKELHAAITHHDDGWAVWDAEPGIDPEQHRPYSFREMPLTDSLRLWSGSIESAARHGNLAGWVVAGHFLALLESTDKEVEPSLASWGEEIQARQTERLARWQRENQSLHTLELAQEALRWLQLLDVISLWLCSACPTLQEQTAELPDDYVFGEGEDHETKLTCGSSLGTATIAPWRFDIEELSVNVTADLVPIREYRTTAELLAAQSSCVVEWTLKRQV